MIFAPQPHTAQLRLVSRVSQQPHQFAGYGKVPDWLGFGGADINNMPDWIKPDMVAWLNPRAAFDIISAIKGSYPQPTALPVTNFLAPYMPIIVIGGIVFFAMTMFRR
jgi:hypothetical protein